MPPSEVFIKIIPLLHRPCEDKDLSWALSLLQTVDFTGDFEAGSRELLRIWGIGWRA
jgi:hypothetical protein